MANQLGDAPTKTEEEQSMTSWTPSEKENSKTKYGCDILIENGTLEQVSTKDCPNDGMKSINYGKGTYNPKTWGIEPPKTKKRK